MVSAISGSIFFLNGMLIVINFYLKIVQDSVLSTVNLNYWLLQPQQE